MVEKRKFLEYHKPCKVQTNQVKLESVSKSASKPDYKIPTLEITNNLTKLEEDDKGSCSITHESFYQKLSNGINAVNI